MHCNRSKCQKICDQLDGNFLTRRRVYKHFLFPGSPKQLHYFTAVLESCCHCSHGMALQIGRYELKSENKEYESS